MAPPITKEAEKQLHELYYGQKFFFGRDKLYARAKELGIDVSRRQVWDWLSSQELNQLFRPTRYASKIIPTVMDAPYKQIGIDLIDFSNREYKGYKWIMTAVDLFSKMVWAVAMKNKTNVTVVNGMKLILKKINHKVSSIRSDNGSEFKSKQFQKLMEDNDIKQVFSLPYKPQSNGQVERTNGTLKQMILKDLQAKDSYDWVSSLDTIVRNINNAEQSTTGMKPNDVADEDTERNKEVKEKIKRKVTRKLVMEKPKFKVGQKVRIATDKEELNEGITGHRWSKKIYTIDSMTIPANKIAAVSYRVKGIKRKLYQDELQLIESVKNTTEQPKKYVVKKLVEPKVQRGVQGYIVRWRGYKEADDTFEPREKLLEDVPKIVNKFEKQEGIKWSDKTGRFYYVTPKMR